MPAEDNPPIFSLAERMVAYAVSRKRSTQAQMSVTAARFNTDSIEFDLTANGLTFLFDGQYTAEVRIEDTTPAETRCAIQLVSGRGAGRIAEKLSSLLPDSWINKALSNWFPGLRRDGAAYVISNRDLARSLVNGTSSN